MLHYMNVVIFEHVMLILVWRVWMMKKMDSHYMQELLENLGKNKIVEGLTTTSLKRCNILIIFFFFFYLDFSLVTPHFVMKNKHYISKMTPCFVWKKNYVMNSSYNHLWYLSTKRKATHHHSFSRHLYIMKFLVHPLHSSIKLYVHNKPNIKFI